MSIYWHSKLRISVYRVIEYTEYTNRWKNNNFRTSIEVKNERQKNTLVGYECDRIANIIEIYESGGVKKNKLIDHNSSTYKKVR